MKHRSIVLLLFAASLIFAEYHPLTEIQKTEFRESYKAIRMAFEERNYKAIIYFTPELIKRYESIMLDPDCRKMRSQFLDMSKKLDSVKKMKKADSLGEILSRIQLENDKNELLVAYDTILPVLLENDSSTFKSHYAYYQHLVGTYMESEEMETYTFLSGLKYVNPETLQSYGQSIKKKFEVRIAQLSAIMNADSIIAFKKRYPHIHSDDVDALIERSRLSMRQSISRHPTVYDYLHYRELFGDDKYLKNILYNAAMKEALRGIPDIRTLKEYVKIFPKDEQEIWGVFEDSLYTKWRKTRDPVRADIYFRFYPQGRYSSVINEARIQPPVVYTPGYYSKGP